MDSKTYGIGILTLTAVALLIANLFAPRPAVGDRGGLERRHAGRHRPLRAGRRRVYLLDNSSGKLAVFTLDKQRRPAAQPSPTSRRRSAKPAARGGNGNSGGQAVTARGNVRIAPRSAACAHVPRPHAQTLSHVHPGGTACSHASRRSPSTSSAAGSSTAPTPSTSPASAATTSTTCSTGPTRSASASMGRDVKFCAIVAAKVGGCSEDCKFCAQSEHHDGPAKEQSQAHRRAGARQRLARRRGRRRQLRHRQLRPRPDAARAGRLAQADHDEDRQGGQDPRLRDARRADARDGQVPLRLRHPPDQPQHRDQRAALPEHRLHPPVRRAHQHAEGRQGSRPVAVQRRDLRHGRGLGRPARHDVHAPRAGRGRDADQLPQRDPRHAAGGPAAAAADGVPEDHQRSAGFVLPDGRAEGGRRAREGAARPAELDLLRRRRQHDDRQLPDDLRPQARAWTTRWSATSA